MLGRPIALACACVFLLTALPAWAQSPPPSTAQSTPEALQVARDIVAKLSGDTDRTLNALRVPMTQMMQTMGLRDPERAQVVVSEVLMPILKAHLGDLVDVRAEAFAQALSLDDLRSISAFYDTPAGRHMIEAQPRMSQAFMVGLNSWLQGLKPEMTARMQEELQRRGWMPSPAATPSPVPQPQAR